MQEIEGKIVLTEIEEIVDPSHTALVILGAQNSAVDLIFNKNEFMSMGTLYALDWYKNRKRQIKKSTKKLVVEEDYTTKERVAEQVA